MKNKATRQNVLMIGPVPPPTTGQSVMFSLLVDELRKSRSIDTANLSEPPGRRVQQFSFGRVIQVIKLAFSVIGGLSRTSAVYLTIAQSRVGFLRDIVFILISVLWRRPIIAHLHGGNYAQFYESENAVMRFLIRMTLRRVNRLIVLSDHLHKDFSFMGEEFTSRLRTVWNTSNLAPGRKRSPPKAELRLIYLSNLIVEKGYQDCVDAMPHLLRLLPNTKIDLVLAGTYILGNDDYRSVTDMEEALRKQIQYLELEDTVSIVGSIHEQQKQELIDSSHIHVLPTYYQNEGQPITLIEALSAGLPSVTTSWRGISEIVKNRETGLTVPPKDPVAIAEAIAELYSNPELYEKMSRQGPENAELFSVPRHVATIAAVIDETISQETVE
jgi:glycosyltransferase involved in cell wall biosynthesis